MANADPRSAGAPTRGPRGRLSMKKTAPRAPPSIVRGSLTDSSANRREGRPPSEYRRARRTAARNCWASSPRSPVGSEDTSSTSTPRRASIRSRTFRRTSMAKSRSASEASSGIVTTHPGNRANQSDSPSSGSPPRTTVGTPGSGNVCSTARFDAAIACGSYPKNTPTRI